MPESTVAQSIIGTLQQIGGISGRRAQDGLTAQQAQQFALENEATRRALQDDEDRRTFGELDAGGYITIDPKTGRATVDAAKLAKNPELMSRFVGPEANRFLKTTGQNGPEDISFAGVEELPGQLQAQPNPLDNAKGPISLLGQAPKTPEPVQAPSQYVIKLRTKDGRTVPATQNASSAADDTLITLSADDLSKTLQGRLDRMVASGALDNNVTMTKLNLKYQDYADAYIQNAIAQKGPDELTGGDPVASRGFYGILNDLKGDDLKAAAKDAGLDPVALEQEAKAKWEAQQEKLQAEAIPKRTESVKPSLYASAVSRLDKAEKALAAYDASPEAKKAKNTNDIDNAMTAVAQAESGRIGRPTDRKFPAPGEDSKRKALLAERDEAAKAVTAAEAKTQSSGPKFDSNFTPPKFEFTEDNLREAIRGKVGEQPSAQQTAGIAQYAKSQGVNTAQDIQKLPPNDAMALAWVIASNARGATTDQKIAIFDKLANFARTGDTKKSPIDANVAITGARTDVYNAQTNRMQVNALSDYRTAQGQIDWAKLGIEQAKLDRDMSNDIWKKMGDVDTANNKVRGYMRDIYEGTLGDGNKIQAPTPKAMAAWKDLRSDVNQLPKGSPQQIAAQQSYLEGFFQMAAAESVKPGQAAWWDVPKIIANTFMREDGQVNMSPLIETARVEYANGAPVRVSFTDHGGTGKETKLVVGADEFKRFTGASDFTTFVNAIHSQQAVNLLQAGGLPVTPENVQKMIEGIRKSAGMDK